MQKSTIRDVDIAGKRVFIRVDFNVPIKNGVIGDDTRIRGAMPTIEYAIGKGARVILASHLGRPLKDKKKAEENGIPYDPAKYSLKPVYEYLGQMRELQDISSQGNEPVLIGEHGTGLGRAEVKNERVFFASDSVGDAVKVQADALRNGQILLLENLRFHDGEETNDPEFAKENPITT